MYIHIDHLNSSHFRIKTWSFKVWTNQPLLIVSIKFLMVIDWKYIYAIITYLPPIYFVFYWRQPYNLTYIFFFYSSINHFQKPWISITPLNSRPSKSQIFLTSPTTLKKRRRKRRNVRKIRRKRREEGEEEEEEERK